MDENKDDLLPLDELEEELPRSPEDLNAIEKFYERFRDVPLKRIDFFIGCCVAALILVVVIGALKGNGII